MIVLVADRRQRIVGAAYLAAQVYCERLPRPYANAGHSGVHVVAHVVLLAVGGVGKLRECEAVHGIDQPVRVVVPAEKSEPLVDPIVDVGRIRYRTYADVAEINRGAQVEAGIHFRITGVPVDPIAEDRRVVNHRDVFRRKKLSVKSPATGRLASPPTTITRLAAAPNCPMPEANSS